jgi:predicted PurR-regulated permease PerM
MTSEDEEGTSGTGPEEAGEETSDSSARKANGAGRNGSLESSAGGGDDGGGGGDGSDDGAAGGGEVPWYRNVEYARRVVFPLLTVSALLIVLIAFQQILLPFVFACALVYLMEPIVVRLSRTPRNPRGLPRWITVILVYLVFFGVVTGAGVLVVPRFAGELLRFTQTAPQGIQKFREERLPKYNEKIQQYIGTVVPDEQTGDELQEAKRGVGEARAEATRRAAAWSRAREAFDRAVAVEWEWEFRDDGLRERVFSSHGGKPARLDSSHDRHGRWRIGREAAEPAFRLVPTPDRGLEVYVNSGAVEFAKVDEQRWTVQRATPESDSGDEKVGEDLRGKFDLEAKLNEVLEEAATFSNEQLAELVEFIQHLLIGILEAFVAIILTLMVAAFISIDLPRFMGFFRSLVPETLRGGYDELLQRVDRGLSGVIRGQLIICLVNGIFTFIGLWLFEVKFSVLLAVIAGVFSIIPVFGTVISTIPICVIAATQSLTTALLVLGWILLIHFVEGNILNPKIIGTSAEIHPVIVIFALLAGESTYGLVGAILGVPVASILLSSFKFFRDKVWDEQ